MNDKNSTPALFEGKQIRRVWNENQWYFSVVDVVGVLTESPSPQKYWYQIKEREFERLQLSPIWRQLKLLSADGKSYLTDCSNTENMLRIVQSIPSKKAEPFKLWLAKVGYQRIQEIQNPELAQQRMKELYRLKGYSDAWIEKRVRGIAVRDELTDEWKNRGVKQGNEFSILTAEISKATFELTPNEHKIVKGLRKENLRDHMNNLELIFTMLGEASTTDIARAKNVKGFVENKVAAKRGGEVAGVARKEHEKNSGRKVVSQQNYLSEPESTKRIEQKKYIN